MEIKEVQKHRDETVDATQKKVQKDFDQDTVQTTEADMWKDDTPTNQEVDELLKDTVEETAQAEIRQLDTPPDVVWFISRQIVQ